MQNEIIESENNSKVVYEPPTFENAGSFRDSTGVFTTSWSDTITPGIY